MADYGTRLINDLPEQFKGGARIEALMSVIGRQLDELSVFYSQINLQRSLKTATGRQLDEIGEILVMTRKEASMINGRDSDHEMDDTDYRAALGYKIMLNYGNATYYDIVRGVKNFCNVYPIRYSEDKDSPASFVLELEIEEGSPVILRNLLPIRAAGVGCSYQFRISSYIEVSSDLTQYPYEICECGTLICGTHPVTATLGNRQDTAINASSEADMLAYAPPFTGTVPDTATIGFIDSFCIGVSSDISDLAYIGCFAGGDTCGTCPDTKTIGLSQYAVVDADSYTVSQAYDPVYCGDEPVISLLGYTGFATAAAGSHTGQSAYGVPPLGDDICGTGYEPSTIGRTDGSEIGISGTSGFDVYGTVQCGDEPVESTVGITGTASTAAMSVENDSIYEPAQSGTNPSDSTMGQIIETAAESAVAGQPEAYPSDLTGQRVCGNDEGLATYIGHTETEGVSIGDSEDSYTYDSDISGEKPYTATCGAEESNDVCVTVTESGSAYTAGFTGQEDCGTMPIITTDIETYIAQEMVCGAKYCGEPQERSD